MTGGKNSITLRFSDAIFNQIDEIITYKRYSSRTEFMYLAIYSAISKESLERDLQRIIINEAGKLMDQKFYSPEYEMHILNICDTFTRKFLDEMKKERK